MSALHELFRRRLETVPAIRPSSGSPIPELVLSPDLAVDLAQLVLQPEQWAEARGHLAALGLYERYLRNVSGRDETGPNGTDRFDAVQFIERLGPIDIEVPVIKQDSGNPDPWDVVRATAWNARRAVDYVHAHSGRVRSLNFDDPAMAALHDYTPALAPDDAAAMIVSWCGELRTHGVESFGWTEAYPGVSREDFTALLGKVAARQPIASVCMDVDWSRLRRDRWPLARVREDLTSVRAAAAALGAGFGVLLVGPDAQDGEQHCAAAMELLREIPAYLGGVWPDRLVLQSFDIVNGVRDVPPLLPERSADGAPHRGTHTGLVLRVAEYIAGRT